MSRARFLIDTDCAADDGVALVMALLNPDAEVVAITTVAGNVPLEQTTQNALYVTELCGAAVPVIPGAAGPVLRPLQNAAHVHGRDGFGDVGLKLNGRVPAPGRAADAIVDMANRHPGELTLVALGPLTNLAAALLKDPDLPNKVARCVVMGGAADGRGNTTPVAEFNFWADPEAARIVFRSGLHVTMVGWDLTCKASAFSRDELEELRAVGGPVAAFCADIQRGVLAFSEKIGRNGFFWADPLAMAVALDPAVATDAVDRYVDVEIGDGICRGMSVVDWRGQMGVAPNATIVLSAHRPRFDRLIRGALERGRSPAPA